jgi:hypothetical protein
MNGIVPSTSRPATKDSAPAPTGTTMSQALDFWINNTEKDVVFTAGAMPEETYAFKPAAGEFVGVRTFAQQVKHLAANNYRMAARVLGQPATPDQESETGPLASSAVARGETP